MKRIGILTRGGDAPGMNAAIRAVVRTGLEKGWDVFGVQRGYSGLISGHANQMRVRDVGGIIQQGGTILGSARCKKFQTENGRRKAIDFFHQIQLDALVVIGGNGSQAGAYELSQMDIPVVGIASTIDNDLYGADITIGVDTALNVALEAIDRLKITATFHERAFLVETMGRDCGYLALMAGIAGGAEVIVIPESETDPDSVAAKLRSAYERGKGHAIVVVAEGARHNADAIAHHFSQHKERLGFALRVTKLGHVQRGGSPGSFDRLLGTRLGAAATQHLAEGTHGVLLGQKGGKIVATDLNEVVTQHKSLELDLLNLAETLAK